MTDEDPNVLFEKIRTFGWHERKRQTNLRRHKIDFENVRGIFDWYTFIRRSDRHDEIRYQVFGYVDGREVAVACTLRSEICWIISARRASRKERRQYYNRFSGRAQARKD